MLTIDKVNDNEWTILTLFRAGKELSDAEGQKAVKEEIEDTRVAIKAMDGKVLDDLPRTPTGKVRRTDLEELLRADRNGG